MADSLSRDVHAGGRGDFLGYNGNRSGRRLQREDSRRNFHGMAAEIGKMQGTMEVDCRGHLTEGVLKGAG